MKGGRRGGRGGKRYKIKTDKICWRKRKEVVSYDRRERVKTRIFTNILTFVMDERGKAGKVVVQLSKWGEEGRLYLKRWGRFRYPT